MADSNLPLDPSLSHLRRRLLTARPAAADIPQEPAPANDVRAGSIDFDNLSDEPVARVPVGYDEVEALLRRYQKQKEHSDSDPEVYPTPQPKSVRRASLPPTDPRPSVGSFHGEVLRPSGGSRQGVSPQPSQNGHGDSELDKLHTENAELRAMVAELRQYLEENDPRVWEERIQQADAALVERDEAITAQKKQLDEWQERLQTQRFVPSDDELAVMADEMEKERCQLGQERKKLEDDRRQLQDDEESLMKQMREMEMGMAKERAELARQRTDLQRLHAEVQHEIDLLERGDGNMKERLAQFQRRHMDVMRPAGPPRESPLPVAPLCPPPPVAAKPKDSGMFKRLFGQG